MIRVRNRHNYDGPGEYIGRPSPLGNIFSHTGSKKFVVTIVRDRDEAIRLYEEWLDEQLESDTPARRMFQDLVDKYRKTGSLDLICYCAPLRCHGDVLASRIKISE